MIYNCKCTTHLYNGITTSVNNETLEIETDSEEDARLQAENKIKNRYRTMSHLSLSSVAVTIESRRNNK